MSPSMAPALLLLVLAYHSIPTHGLSLALDSHFNEWYPQYADRFQIIMADNCSVEYDNWVNHRSGYDAFTTEHPEAIASKIVSCIYDSPILSEAVRANIASAGVLLGFLPTILALFGANAAEASLLSLRRPFLALLLAFGSPAPDPKHSFEYDDPAKLLAQKGNIHLTVSNLGPSRKAMILLSQYVVAMCCAANTIELALELGIQCVSSWAPSRIWTVLLWTILGVVVHLFSCLCMRLHVKLDRDVETSKGKPWLSRLTRVVRDEFTLCAVQKPVKFKTNEQSGLFVFWSWWTWVGTASQIVYGTLTFSGLLFISVKDAAIIVLRYFLSALVCRIILMFEVNGMRQAVKIEESQDAQDMELSSQTPPARSAARGESQQRLLGSKTM